MLRFRMTVMTEGGMYRPLTVRLDAKTRERRRVVAKIRKRNAEKGVVARLIEKIERPTRRLIEV